MHRNGRNSVEDGEAVACRWRLLQVRSPGRPHLPGLQIFFSLFRLRKPQKKGRSARAGPVILKAKRNLPGGD